MLFKFPALEAEYNALHPRVRNFGEQLTAYCKAKGYPEPVATHIKRTIAEQVDIYWQLIQTQLGCTEEVAKAKAAARPTLHLTLGALDLRDFIYTAAQIEDLLRWSRAYIASSGHGPGEFWELLYHDVGRGKHFHIGFNDPQWNNTFKVVTTGK